MSQRIGVLFVCLGNICRSPLAEGIFIHLAQERGVLDRFDIDSCGTGGWHVGNPPDKRSVAVARKHGIELPSRARKLNARADFDRFEWVLAMDRANHADLIAAGSSPRQTHLMMAFHADHAASPSTSPDVPDPYYGGRDGFDTIYDMLTGACDGLLSSLTQESV